MNRGGDLGYKITSENFFLTLKLKADVVCINVGCSAYHDFYNEVVVTKKALKM